MSDSPLLPSNAKWLYLPYVVCRIGKGAATAAPRLSFLSPSSSSSSSLHGYPNFTPESQYLLITLQGIVLYSPPPLPPSLPPSPHDLCGGQPFLSSFFPPPLTPPSLFSRKKRNTRFFFRSRQAPPPPARSCSSRYFFRSGV